MADLNISIIASSDDAEEPSAPAVPNLTSSDLDFYGGPNEHVGLRFQNATIPAGATILTAVIRFTAHNSRSPVLHPQTIYCQDVDDAPTFTTDSGNVSTRNKTNASANWQPSATTAEAQFDTANFAAALQEVIDRPGWASGQDVAVLFVGAGSEDNAADAWAFDHGSDVPQIRITYGEVTAGYALVF